VFVTFASISERVGRFLVSGVTNTISTTLESHVALLNKILAFSLLLLSSLSSPFQGMVASRAIFRYLSGVLG
jgi:hypothetical protein